MATRPKVTMALGKPALKWLRERVENGVEPSIGWAVERLVLQEMKNETSKNTITEMR